MVTFDWNGLRVGEHVLVHDHGAVPLVAGVVKSVERRPPLNVIGISTPGGSRRVLWPAAEHVHLDPLPAADPTCWRCVAGATAGGGQP